MKLQTACLLLVLLACQMAMANEEENALRGITLSVQDEPHAFGRDLKMEMRYYNKDEKAWSIVDPKQSPNVHVRRHRFGADPGTGGYSLGRWHSHTETMSDGTTITLWSAPPPTKINIRSNDFHKFTVLFDHIWVGHIKPGRWIVWIVDENVKLESNRLEITLIFTNDSIALCLENARDKDANVSKRRWHAEYLQKIMPDLHLRWWHMPPNDLEPQVQEPLEQAIQHELDRFEAFWEDEANAPVIKAAIDRINREAGLEVNDANGENTSNQDE